jgi:hypothetical protein
LTSRHKWLSLGYAIRAEKNGKRGQQLGRAGVCSTPHPGIEGGYPETPEFAHVHGVNLSAVNESLQSPRMNPKYGRSLAAIEQGFFNVLGEAISMGFTFRWLFLVWHR